MSTPSDLEMELVGELCFGGSRGFQRPGQLRGRMPAAWTFAMRRFQWNELNMK
jgi:hypothetical protein